MSDEPIIEEGEYPELPRRLRFAFAAAGAAGLLAPACAQPAPAHRTSSSTTPRVDAGADAGGSETATSVAPVTTSAAAGPSTPAAADTPTTTVTVTVPTEPRTTTTFALPERADDDLSDEEWWANQPGYGPWSIPTYVVMCESGGSWTARNASGAAGPYQLMPEHFGGESALNQSPEAQHAKAAYLWNGGVNTRSGLGPQNWKACL